LRPLNLSKSLPKSMEVFLRLPTVSSDPHLLDPKQTYGWGMGDDTGKRDRGCRQLGGHAAGPEHGDFSGSNGDRIAEIRCGQIADTDFFGISQVNRGTVGEM
jgi:hypothetical protein